jgi:hypothetical protein
MGATNKRLIMTCELPPKKPVVHSVAKKSIAAKPSGIQEARSESSSESCSNQSITINTVPAMPTAPVVQTKYVIRNVPGKTQYVVKPRKPFTLFVLVGSTPTKHKVGETHCDFAKNQCKVDVTTKRVLDLGLGGSYTFNSGLQLGAIGTGQGNFFGTIGFNF